MVECVLNSSTHSRATCIANKQKWKAHTQTHTFHYPTGRQGEENTEVPNGENKKCK